VKYLHLLPLTSRYKHRQNTPITRLVTGFSLKERRLETPAKAGFVNAVGIEPSLVLFAATKPKAYFAGVFCFVRSYTRQGASANRSEWTVPKRHRHRIHPRPRRPAFLSGTEQDWGPTVETSPLRVNDSLKGLWVAEQDSVSGSGKESLGFHPCQTYGKTKSRSE
jgi:hypothetical protein